MSKAIDPTTTLCPIDKMATISECEFCIQDQTGCNCDVEGRCHNADCIKQSEDDAAKVLPSRALPLYPYESVPA